ncbi:hypothetical protein [Bacillus safensis]|uniref:hypothetical protein n=1 Tax=Bacillus safensis TaxID=561879 RepID=UPI0036EE1C53
MSANDPNDPRNYSSFESFRQGAFGPWSEEGFREAWLEAHPSEPTTLEEQKQLCIPEERKLCF